MLGYARVIELAGQSARVDVVVPYTWLSGDAVYAGAPVERVVDGASDVVLRLTANLYGAPAMIVAACVIMAVDVGLELLLPG